MKEKILIGIAHGPNFYSAEEFERNLHEDPFTRASWKIAMNGINALPPGSTIAVEGLKANKPIFFFERIKSAAEALGHKVVSLEVGEGIDPSHPYWELVGRLDDLRRQTRRAIDDGYDRYEAQRMAKSFEAQIRQEVVEKYQMPVLKSMPVSEARKLKFLEFEKWSNRILLNLRGLDEEPAMIVAGAGHAIGLKPHLGNYRVKIPFLVNLYTKPQLWYNKLRTLKRYRVLVKERRRIARRNEE